MRVRIGLHLTAIFGLLYAAFGLCWARPHLAYQEPHLAHQAPYFAHEEPRLAKKAFCPRDPGNKSEGKVLFSFLHT
jgi:hypothetical protein